MGFAVTQGGERWGKLCSGCFQTPPDLFCAGFFLWSSQNQFRAVDHHIPLKVQLQTSLSNPQCFWNKHRDKSRQGSFSSQGPGGWQLQLWFSKKSSSCSDNKDGGHVHIFVVSTKFLFMIAQQSCLSRSVMGRVALSNVDILWNVWVQQESARPAWGQGLPAWFSALRPQLSG